jgi:hypothetical protein
MGVLGKVASLAYQTLEPIGDLKLQIVERGKAETALRGLTDALETRVRIRTEELSWILERPRGVTPDKFCELNGSTHSASSYRLVS